MITQNTLKQAIDKQQITITPHQLVTKKDPAWLAEMLWFIDDLSHQWLAFLPKEQKFLTNQDFKPYLIQHFQKYADLIENGEIKSVYFKPYLQLIRLTHTQSIKNDQPYTTIQSYYITNIHNGDPIRLQVDEQNLQIQLWYFNDQKLIGFKNIEPTIGLHQFDWALTLLKAEPASKLIQLLRAETPDFVSSPITISECLQAPNRQTVLLNHWQQAKHFQLLLNQITYFDLMVLIRLRNKLAPAELNRFQQWLIKLNQSEYQQKYRQLLDNYFMKDLTLTRCWQVSYLLFLFDQQPKLTNNQILNLIRYLTDAAKLRHRLNLSAMSNLKTVDWEHRADQLDTNVLKLDLKHKFPKQVFTVDQTWIPLINLGITANYHLIKNSHDLIDRFCQLDRQQTSGFYLTVDSNIDHLLNQINQHHAKAFYGNFKTTGNAYVMLAYQSAKHHFSFAIVGEEGKPFENKTDQQLLLKQFKQLTRKEV